MEKEQFYYDNKIVKMFLWATILWGIVGMLVGLLVALLFVFPGLLEFAGADNAISWLSFGRLRPLHTNAVIFAFVGNGIFLGIYYSTQRLLKARMFNDVLSRIHFWGWQAIIVAAAITLPLGYECYSQLRHSPRASQRRPILWGEAHSCRTLSYISQLRHQ